MYTCIYDCMHYVHFVHQVHDTYYARYMHYIPYRCHAYCYCYCYVLRYVHCICYTLCTLCARNAAYYVSYGCHVHDHACATRYAPRAAQLNYIHRNTRDTKLDSLRGSSAKIGTIQRTFAWPLRNDDTLDTACTTRALHTTRHLPHN